MRVWYESGDLLQSDVQALVNPVNCEGVMGKGLVLQFRRRYPRMYHDYAEVCREGKLRPGVLHIYNESSKIIVNFPTKDKWRNPSRARYSMSGLGALKSLILNENITSIAIPPLGCGLGGLDWKEVRPLILCSLKDIEDLDVRFYGTPPTEGEK